MGLETVHTGWRIATNPPAAPLSITTFFSHRGLAISTTERIPIYFFHGVVWPLMFHRRFCCRPDPIPCFWLDSARFIIFAISLFFPTRFSIVPLRPIHYNTSAPRLFYSISVVDSLQYRRDQIFPNFHKSQIILTGKLTGSTIHNNSISNS